MSTRIIVRQRNYWGSGNTLAEAKRNYRKVSGRQATNLASIIMFQGDTDELDRIEIDDVLGGIRYPEKLKQTILQ